MCDGKFYGIAFIDNSIGERDVAYSVAVKRNGEYYHLESNRPVLEYVGDEIINVVEISLEAKRKPLSDGTLDLTEEELEELFSLTGRTNDGKYPIYFFKNVCIEDCDRIYADMSRRGENYEKDSGHILITNVKAILWLADRFELTSNN